MLSLREGSIIVVTIVTAIYFSANTSSFFTGDNFKTLLPYFAPFAILAAGEVFVMILGEIDLSIGAMYLFAPILFYKLDTAVGLGLVPARDRRAARLHGRRRDQRLLRRRRRHQLVRDDARRCCSRSRGCALIISHGTPVATPGAAAHTTTEKVQHVVNGHTITLPEKVQPLGTFAKVFGGGIYSELIWAVAIVVDPAGRADVHALGAVHGRDRLEQARRGRGRREGRSS